MNEHDKRARALNAKIAYITTWGTDDDAIMVPSDNVTFKGYEMADETRKSKVRSFSTTEENSALIDAELSERGIGLSDLLDEMFKARYGDEWEDRNDKGDILRIERMRNLKKNNKKG